MSRCLQSTASLAGAADSTASTAVPTPPPVSTTDPVPEAASESTSLVTRRAATALASSCASRCTMTSGTLTLYLPLASGALLGVAFPRRSFLAPQSRRRRAPLARSRAGPSRERAKRFRVDLVGFEPAQLLGDQLGRLAPGQRHPAIRPAGPGQGGRPSVWPEQHDLPVRSFEADLGDPGAGRLAARHRDTQAQAEPGRDQVGGRVVGFGHNLAAEQLGEGLVP